MTELKNACYAFYKKYLDIAYEKGQDPDAYKKLNKQFLDIVNSSVAKEILEYGKKQCGMIAESFTEGSSDRVRWQKRLKVTYPGALIGSGYPHITGKMKGEFQNGFSFDHINGAPFYPGSSLKGVIENVFERAVKGRQNEKDGYANYLIHTMHDVTGKQVTLNEINTIWKQSFQGILSGQTEKWDTMFNRDIFYDAYITGVTKTPYNLRGDIIGDDIITPHESSLKEPKPITILRLMPGVELTFTMFLHSVKNEKGDIILPADDKGKLFQEIIKEMGIGSRTNLGYGVLDE